MHALSRTHSNSDGARVRRRSERSREGRHPPFPLALWSVLCCLPISVFFLLFNHCVFLFLFHSTPLHSNPTSLFSLSAMEYTLLCSLFLDAYETLGENPGPDDRAIQRTLLNFSTTAVYSYKAFANTFRYCRGLYKVVRGRLEVVNSGIKQATQRFEAALDIGSPSFFLSFFLLLLAAFCCFENNKNKPGFL